jgi:hypothetical protein
MIVTYDIRESLIKEIEFSSAIGMMDLEDWGNGVLGRSWFA